MDETSDRTDDLDDVRQTGERGASLVEYGLLLALIAIVCIVAVTTLGGNLNESFDSSGDSLFGS